MNQDKTTLQAQLERYTKDWAGLQAAIAQREQEIRQIDQRRIQLNEEIHRNQGAMAYCKILTDETQKVLNEMEKTVVGASQTGDKT